MSKKKRLSSLVTRTITGILYVALILAAILSNSPEAITWLLALFAALGVYEYQTIVGANKYALMLRIWHALMAALLLYVARQAITYGLQSHTFVVALLPYLLYYTIYLLSELYRAKRSPFDELAHAIFAHIYVVLPLATLLLLTSEASQVVLQERLSGAPHLSRTFWVLPIFLLIWLNDTGAYVIGTLIGRHKLMPHVSPHKTIEGLLGGLLFTLLGGTALHLLFPALTTLIYWFGLALIITIFGTWGDLLESLLKRTYGVKDSGTILPGHGGILDRLDSLLLATPPAYLYISLLILS